MVRSFLAIVGAVTVCSATCVQAATIEETLFALEQKVCNAVAAKDMKAFGELVAPNAVIVEDGKVQMAHAEGLKAHVDDVKIDKFELSQPKVTQISDDVAVLSFYSDTSATRNGKKLPAKHHVSTTFAKRNGNWQVVYTTSYPLQN
jgi:uncharacterized protein (TIGR02246 family)